MRRATAAVRTAVLQRLEQGPHTVEELVKATGYRGQTIRYQLNELSFQGVRFQKASNTWGFDKATTEVKQAEFKPLQIPAPALRRPGSEDFKHWPSLMGGKREAYGWLT